MNWKKVLLVVLAVLLAVALIGCGGTGTDDAVDTTATEETPAGLKIAIVTSPSGVDDGSFNQNAYEGIQAFLQSPAGAGSTVTHIQENDMANSVPAVEQIVGEYDVIVMPGFQFGGITEVAQANPDKYFILVDEWPAKPGTTTFETVEVDNVYAMKFAEQESGFFAGVAAALETKTNKVAFIGGMAVPPVINYQRGFESGVAYANKNLGTNAELVNIASYAGKVDGESIGGNYTGDFVDTDLGKKVGEAVLAEGADVLFVAAGGSGIGAFNATKEAGGGAMVIGCDVDQFALGANGNENIVLTSVLKVMDLNVERQLNAIVNGTFKGGNYVLQADTGSTGFVYTEGNHQLSEETVETLKGLFDKVKGGTIVPASAFSEFGAEDFPGL